MPLAIETTNIVIDGIITRLDGMPFTEEEYEQILDEFIQLIERRKCCYGGSSGLYSDVELMDELD